MGCLQGGLPYISIKGPFNGVSFVLGLGGEAPCGRVPGVGLCHRVGLGVVVVVVGLATSRS